jgi:hypothetical protein
VTVLFNSFADRFSRAPSGRSRGMPRRGIAFHLVPDCFLINNFSSGKT